MRVVMVCDFPRKVDEMGGGVEAVATYLANALQALPDIELEAVTLDRWGGPERTEIQRSVRVHFVPLSRRPSRLSNRQNVARLCRRMLELDPDLVHAHIANQYAASALRTGKPWVLTAHGIRHLEMSLRPGFANRYREWVTRREEFRLMRAADHLISISPFINDVFGDTIRAQTTLIDNPVDEAFFGVQRQPEPGRVLYVGRLIPRKDLLTLLTAFRRVLADSPSSRLRLAGEGISGREPSGYPRELMDYIVANDMTDRIEFLGQLDDAALLEEYARCDLMAVSSVLETAPMVILQAMAAGVPVASTDVGGIRHLIDDGRSGALVSAGDHQGLGDHMARMIGDRGLLQSMSAASREIAESRFRASDIALKTRDVYRAALAASGV